MYHAVCDIIYQVRSIIYSKYNAYDIYVHTYIYISSAARRLHDDGDLLLYHPCDVRSTPYNSRYNVLCVLRSTRFRRSIVHCSGFRFPEQASDPRLVLLSYSVQRCIIPGIHVREGRRRVIFYRFSLTCHTAIQTTGAFKTSYWRSTCNDLAYSSSYDIYNSILLRINQSTAVYSSLHHDVFIPSLLVQIVLRYYFAFACWFPYDDFGVFCYDLSLPCLLV